METIASHIDWAMAYLCVAEAGGFTRAAEQLGCSKAHVSKQVAQLESALGVQLLYRTTRRLTVTEAGQIYLGYCQQLRETLEAAGRAVTNVRQEVSGLLRITAPTTFGEVFLADFLLAFKQRYPAIKVDVDLSLNFRDLEADGFDLGIRSSPGQSDRLIAKPVGVRRDWLVASPALIAQVGAPTRPEQLATLPCIVNGHFRDAERWLFFLADASTSVEVCSWLKINDYQLIQKLCLQGAGFACLPRYRVEPDVQAGRLQRVMPDYDLPYFPIYLVYPYRQPQPAKVRALIDFASEWFAGQERVQVRL
ncbi:LysR family transcriptional regulator [Parachitinimonas caeni]|uniref:LysR family transcriptional regulator n=1 Tax=Parachitinimonas caeni TaxID=3031301 RepID=A0ABT7DV91_9NEIS|nr:LysR family transcriptional regulator [Parachitinimonas caeni]MDK2123979.1 LysR family transcriptional regulator [Parachitinimonas caeni]